MLKEKCWNIFNLIVMKCVGRNMSHPVSKMNQVLPICMSGSSSIHIVTSLVNNRNNIM
jgi:hypothetical protein